MGDEAMLFHAAVEDNAAGRLTVHGLRGTRGVDYGPAAIYFYRLCLLFTSDLVVVAFLKSLFVTLLTLFALGWLAGNLRYLKPELILVALVSPYLWFYSRDLWDNSFLVPLVALAFAAYVSFCKDPKREKFFLVLLLLTWASLTHLMCAPCVLGIAIHGIVYHRKWLWRFKGFVVVTLALCLAISVPYLRHLLSMSGGSSIGIGRFSNLTFPLYGARFFSHIAFEYFMGWEWFCFIKNPWLKPLFYFLIGITGVAYLFSFYGGYLCFRKVLKKPLGSDLRTSVEVLVCTIFCLYVLFAFFTGLVSSPHYYSGVWIIYFYFLWVGMSESLEKRWVRKTIGLYLVTTGFFLLLAVGMLHKNHGNRVAYYTSTLGNQLEIARKRTHYAPDTPLVVEASWLQRSSLVFEVLLSLVKKQVGSPDSPLKAEKLIVRYAHPEDTESGLLELVAE